MERTWGSWGILLLTLWAVILTLLALARLLLLTQAVELFSDQFGTQMQIWIIFILNALFGVGFGASAYGLWRRHNWGRILFLWLIVIWSASNLFALFLNFINPAAASLAPIDMFLGLLQGILGAIIPLWYLNIPRIKNLFHMQDSQKFIVEDKI